MSRRIVSVAAFLFLALQAHAASPLSDSLVASAWRAWKGASQDTVEKLFRAAAEADPSNARAHLGLALLLTLRENGPESWKEYRTAIRLGENPYPYLFAAWITPRFKPLMEEPGSGVVDLLKELAEDTRADGMVRAQSCELLGQYFREHNELGESDRWFGQIGALKDWMIIGPFDNISASGFDKSFPPEGEFDSAKTLEGKNGVPVHWFRPAAVRPDFWYDFKRYFAYSDAIYYANTFVYSDARRPVQVRIGTSGSLQAFLNDEQLISYPDENNNDLDTYVISTELQQGWNRLLIKCGHSEITQCNFLVRITDERGTPIGGLTATTEARPYARRPGAPNRIIENFAEAYFKDLIARRPEQMENYVLLADTYARNDKAVEAELALREAMKRSPDCPLMLNSLIEAYLRGQKYDEMYQTIDKARSVDPGLPAAMTQSIERAVDNEDFDEAQNVLRLMEQRLPGSRLLYEGQLRYYAKRKQVDKIIETTREALRRYPDEWGFVYLQTVIDVQTTQRYDEAIALLNDFLKRRYSETALSTLADYELRSSQIDRWEETYNRLLKIEPCAPGYYYAMAQAYITLQQYPKAEQALRGALAICPNGSAYWSRLGDVYRATMDSDRARAAYRSALLYSPTDYDARETLRELEGKKSIFSWFSAVNIDSLRKHAPAATAYPNDRGVILLDDTRSVVFDRGASMTACDLLIKLFTPSGINDFKEYRINYNSNVQQLIVEKAVTIKKDGSEVKADVDHGSIVFKSLEENDCVYLKWKVKNYYGGKLSRHFWDTHYFNGFYPVGSSRYALLVPDGLPFSSRVQNMPENERRTKTDDGTIHEWILTDQPAIRYEKDMPGVDDVGKVLSVSSIPSWQYLADWFSDLAHAKVRSSYEIKEQVNELLSGKERLSDQEKVTLIYNFITENIRYSSVPFRQSAFVPQKARDVLVNRIGDCKDMATLCIAMLKEAGIDAHFVLVTTRDEGKCANALPNVLFNHCIAAVTGAGKTQYLDLTANNFPIGSVPPPDVDAFCLDVTPGSTSPAYLLKKNFAPSSVHRTTTGVLGEDHSMTMKRSSLRIGGVTASMRDSYRFKGDEDRQKNLVESLGQDYPGVSVSGLSFSNLDAPVDRLGMTYDMEIPRYATESGKFLFMKIPWGDNLSASEALSYEKRSYVYNYWPDVDTLTEEIRITLPKGYVPVEPVRKASYSCSIAEYHSTLNYARGVLTGVRVMVNRQPVVSPADYAAFKKFYNNAMKEDNTHVLLQKKGR